MVDTMSRWAKAQTKRVEALTRRVAIIAVTWGRAARAVASVACTNNDDGAVAAVCATAAAAADDDDDDIHNVDDGNTAGLDINADHVLVLVNDDGDADDVIEIVVMMIRLMLLLLP